MEIIDFWNNFTRFQRSTEGCIFLKKGEIRFRQRILVGCANMLSTGDSFSLVFPHTEQDRREVLKSGRRHSALARDLYMAIKVRQRRNDFFKPTFLPKTNKQIQLYYYDTSGWLVFARFLEEIEDTKKTVRN